jgi:2-C-methyl-D-erythritol 4-phosphate cytidylyltransferase
MRGGDARVGGVLVAAGRGERLGAGRPKALATLHGRALVELALEGLRGGGVDRLVVVHPAGEAEAFAPLVGDAHLVEGGASRTDSVRAGVAALPDDVEVVAVHDAARALTPCAVIADAVAAVGGGVVAAAPARPVADTLKRVVRGEGGTQRVVGTVHRDDLAAVQTPQVFPRAVLERALAAGRDASDDLGLVEALLEEGDLEGSVVLVAGSPLGLKVTWPDDVVVAEALLAAHR